MPSESLFLRAERVLYPLLRMFVAAILMQHGVQKLFGWLVAANDARGGVAAFGELQWFAGVIETFGGLCVLFGLFTRPVAFLIAGEMAYAYWFVHFKRQLEFWPILNRGELAAVLCFMFLYIAARGPGRFSLDGLWRGRRGAGLETVDPAALLPVPGAPR